MDGSVAPKMGRTCSSLEGYTHRLGETGLTRAVLTEQDSHALQVIDREIDFVLRSPEPQN